MFRELFFACVVGLALVGSVLYLLRPNYAKPTVSGATINGHSFLVIKTPNVTQATYVHDPDCKCGKR